MNVSNTALVRSRTVACLHARSDIDKERRSSSHDMTKCRSLKAGTMWKTSGLERYSYI